ncbi:MAG: serine hydroxymethyltransferase [Planctomycetes bacterium]|nr:serine hydroxymethyltransferase [Planctomycetota bacterium]
MELTFKKALLEQDAEIAELIAEETRLQGTTIRLIPSENYASDAVLEATGSVLANKYSEGYPGRRYYEGQEVIDRVETIAIERAKALFGAEHANVQPYSGSPANMAVYFALAGPGDAILGLGLPFGGHLTHGWGVNFSGKLFQSFQYGLDPRTKRIDLDHVRDLARRHRPGLIFAGGTAYPRVWDFEGFRGIADEVGAILVADIAHIAGLVVGGVHPSPIPHAGVVTTTTHKTLRGPRGGMILCRKEFAEVIDRAVFPTLQGGPHNHTTAAIAVALREASTPEFRDYAGAIVRNAKALAAGLLGHGFDLVTGGTDNHLILVDLTSKGLPGKRAAKALARAGIISNYNTVPFDKRKPFDPSGLRLGTPAVTSRGMGESEMELIADWIDRVLARPEDEAITEQVRGEVHEVCERFPAPGIPL